MPDKETTSDLFARLLFSVAVPTSIAIGALYIFNSLGDIKYLPASAMAFGVGFFFIHLIFKYWLNTGITQGDSWQQFKRFLIVFAINIAINTEIVYILVTYVEVPILTAQTIATVVVAYESYYAYRSLLLRHDHLRMVRTSKRKSGGDDIIYYDDTGAVQENL